MSLLRRPKGDMRSCFSDGFLFGVGTSAYQCEAYDARYIESRDLWDAEAGRTPRGRATDFWERYPEDIQHAQDLGCTAFRLSLAWPRIEPEPGQFNTAALDHYADLIAALRKAGMTPVVTLLHASWPLWVEQNGSLIAPGFPDLFARYAQQVADRFGREVDWWISLNEPNLLAYGYIKPFWQREYVFPPGLPPTTDFGDQVLAVSQLMRNVFLAHTAARAHLRRANPLTRVGCNPPLLGLPLGLQRLTDHFARQVHTPRQLERQGRRYAQRLLPAHGDVDLVAAALTVTDKRSRQVDFSEAYFVTALTLLIPASSRVTQLADLAGRPVAVVRATTAEARLAGCLPGAQAQRVETYEAAAQAMLAGTADALLGDWPMLAALVTAHPGQFRFLPERLEEQPYAVAVTAGNPQWLDVVDSTVRQFKASGEWAMAYARHFPSERMPLPPSIARRPNLAGPMAMRGQPLLQPLPLARRGTLLRGIQDRGYLLAGVRTDVPGLGQYDARAGTWSGLEIDLCRAIARSVWGDPDRVHFRAIPPQERIPQLRTWSQLLDPLVRPLVTLTTLLHSDWWHLGMGGQLSAFLCPPECVNQFDYVGIDYYWGLPSFSIHRLEQLYASLNGATFTQAPVYAPALYGLLRRHAKDFPSKPIMVVENGCIDVADGIARAEYIRQHVAAVQRACAEGIDVRGYLYWSLTTNRELGRSAVPGNDFGLYHIELDDDQALSRYATPAAEVYANLIHQLTTQPTT